ncbi:hypothetical protein D8674_017776 [Pyrus ussuriensis x Pyrus communis]|uniref:Uncharacterized protein n=1 Tax=Pyrus ussuriensis x Pyrus communis TaxID=2448454 RepID=A0A5N5HDN2_9ROSA|nr:hypothetical protein D8674_017776 [Pyrus ussuriensis x Pyrus communis]
MRKEVEKYINAATFQKIKAKEHEAYLVKVPKELRLKCQAKAETEQTLRGPVEGLEGSSSFFDIVKNNILLAAPSKRILTSDPLSIKTRPI